MADFEILIKTEGASDSVKKFDDIAKATDKAKEATKAHGAEVEGLTIKKGKLLGGFKALGHEIPIIGTLLHALKNPFTLLGVAGVAAFVAIKKSVDEAAESTRLWKESSEKLSTSLTAYTDLKKAIDLVKGAQDSLAKATGSANEVLQGQIDLLRENIEAQIGVVEAEKERQAALIERDEKDPVNKARRLAENNTVFGSRISAMRGSLPGQEAQLVEKQIEQEKQLQRNAADEVPNEASLRESLGQVEEDRRKLEEARRKNRKKTQRAELIRMAAEHGDKINVHSIDSPFTSGQISALGEEGLLEGGGFINVGKAKTILPGAVAESKLTAERVAVGRARLRAGLGALPPGAVKAGLLDGGSVSDFMATAEAESAGTQNSSFARQRTLESQRDKLLRQQQGIVGIDRITSQTTAIKGDTAIADAVDQAAQKQKESDARLLRSLDAKHSADLDSNEKIIQRLEKWENQSRNQR